MINEMTLLKKIHEKGIVGTVWAIIYRIKYFLFYLCRILPIQKNVIVLESEGDLSDNAFALFFYMMENGYLKKYKIVWMVDEIDQDISYEHTVFVEKSPKKPSIRWAYYLGTSKYIIYDHNNLMINLKKRKNQKLIFLSHGCTYKGPKGNNLKCKSEPDEMYVLSEHFVNPMSKWAGLPREKILCLGYPRLDWFLRNNVEIYNKLICYLKSEDANKLFIWMPTFRKSDNPYLSEEYDYGHTGLPILTTVKLIENFNKLLAENKSVCVIKLHHLQAQLGITKLNFSNVFFISDDDIRKMGIQLYQVVTVSDALITDYSSIATDYLLLNKPIIYTLDDYEKYSKSRGMYNIDIVKTMKGEHVFSYDQFVNAVNNIINNVDLYKEERNEWKKVCHKYINGYASERILNHLKIERDK